MNEIVDDVFGKMIYDCSWTKEERLDFYGKELAIRVVAKASSGQEILEKQRESYNRYKEEVSEYTKLISDILLAYYLDNYDEISSEVDIPEKINKENITKEKVVKLVRVTTLFFSRNGEFGYLCDCAWDEENGICILLSGEKPEITEQDYLI